MTERQKAFCEYYVECGNASEAYRKAGYSASENCVRKCANKLLTSKDIKNYIAEIVKPDKDKRIASAEEVMMFFTRVMNGEEKDAFGLDLSMADRINAAKELAKRTVDVQRRTEENTDNLLEALNAKAADLYSEEVTGIES